MVGHLEELWPTSAVVVVAVIASVAFYALAPVNPPRLGARSRLGRRYLRSAPERYPLGWYNAPAVLVLCAIAGLIAVSVFNDDFHRAYVIYSALFFFGIVVPSLLLLVAHREVGFTSLFCTIALLRQRDDWKAALATLALTAGLAILVIHLAFYPWPTQARQVVIGKEAWVVYFSFRDGSDSGCAVIVRSSKDPDASPECTTAAPRA
jgi:hypothetical protein